MIIRILLATCAAASSLCSLELRAQRHIPIGALPTLYNGGFAGEAGEPRVALFSFVESSSYSYFSNEHPISTGTFVSVDHFLKKTRSGIAFTAGQSSTRKSAIDSRITSLTLAISPKFSFRGRYTFAPFANFYFSHGNFEFDPRLYYPVNHESNNSGMKTGFLLNSQKAYVGLSASVLSYYGTGSLHFFSNMSYYLQMGRTFQRTPESKFSFTPQLVVSYYRSSFESRMTGQTEKYKYVTLMDLNLAFRYKKFIAGLNNSGIMFGYQNSKFKFLVTNFYKSRIRYSSPWRPSNHTFVNAQLLFLNAGPDEYTGNISLRYIFRKNPSVKMSGF